jgi:hypothetical protein
VYRGNNFAGDVSQTGGEADIRNNIESVWLPAGTVGTFLVKVRLANLGGDGVPGNLSPADQDFALAVYNGARKDVAVPTFQGAGVTAGANSAPDPGESSQLHIRLGNASTIPLAGARGTLTTKTAGVTITTAAADFPTISAGATGENIAPFAFSVAPNVECGTQIEFAVEISQGGSVSIIRFKVGVGTLDRQELFADDVEGGEANWSHGSLIKKKKNRVDTWKVSTARFLSGTNAWFTPAPSKATDAHLSTVPVQLPSGVRNLRLVFYHTFSFEPGQFDGGVIEISAAGGKFEDLGSRILKGGYNGEIGAFTSNPLGVRPGWVEGRLGEFEQVVVDLNDYAGQTVVIRFRVGTDSSLKGPGWYVDDVTIEGDRPRCVQ